MKDTIFLHNIRAEALIDILPHERIVRQTLLIDLELETDFSAAVESDDINAAIDYAAVADLVCRFARDSRFGLLETFAAALCEALFANFAIDALTLTVKKPGALLQTRDVGLKMRRSRGQ